MYVVLTMLPCVRKKKRYLYKWFPAPPHLGIFFPIPFNFFLSFCEWKTSHVIPCVRRGGVGADAGGSVVLRANKKVARFLPIYARLPFYIARVPAGNRLHSCAACAPCCTWVPRVHNRRCQVDPFFFSFLLPQTCKVNVQFQIVEKQSAHLFFFLNDNWVVTWRWCGSTVE
jgi:hypothetical protein